MEQRHHLSRFQHARDCAREAGEIVPSLVKHRYYTDENGKRWLGRYQMRYEFKPFGEGPFGDGETFCVQPDEIGEAE